MEPSLPQDFTQLLARHQNGEDNLRELIMSAIYGELKRLATHYMASERSGHTLQPTAIVHEAWMRFATQESIAKNKAHFMALAAGVMKQVLIDHARKKLSAKRGGSENLIELDDSIGLAEGGPEELLQLCDTIEKLRELDPRHAQLVELRVFGGLNFEEAAEEMGVSLATVKRDWLLARAWLVRELA